MALSLYELEAKDILLPDYFEEYERHMDKIAEELKQLNGSMFILRSIAEFPFHIFMPHTSIDPFWVIVTNSLFETIILNLNKIMIGKRKDNQTLPKILENVKRNLLSKEHRLAIESDTCTLKFSVTEDCIESNLKVLRDKQIAHLAKNWSMEELKDKLTLNEIDELLQSVNQMFRFLCFEHLKAISWPHYDGKISFASRDDQRTDIEKMLDSIAMNSTIINSPENDSEYWNDHREGMSEKDIEDFNKYRKKFDMPIV